MADFNTHFTTTTPSGKTAHVNGDPAALPWIHAIIDAAAKQPALDACGSCRYWLGRNDGGKYYCALHGGNKAASEYCIDWEAVR